MTTFTFDTGNVEAGGLIIGIENFGEGLGLSDDNFEFLFIDCEIDENIENDANELQITQATFKALNRDNVFKGTILKAAGSIVDARIYVKLYHPESGVYEQCFYGTISPKVKYSENNRIVEFTAYSLIDEMPLKTIDNIYTYLDGSIHLGRTASSYSAGATAIDYTAPIQKKGIAVGEVIRFAAAGTEYTVTDVAANQITISPGLSTGYSSGTYITTKDYQLHIGGVYYVKLDDVIKAVSRLIGCTAHTVNTDRLRFYYDASNYLTFTDLVIVFNNTSGFFNAATKPAESFYAYEGGDESLGVIRAICKSFGLFCDCRSTSPANDIKSYLLFYHKNAPTPPNNTMSMSSARKAIDEDYNWEHIFTEFTVNYPGGTDGPTELIPIHRTLQGALTTDNMFALESGDYRILIYYSGAIYEIHHVDYKLSPEGTWANGEKRGIGVSNRAVRFLLMDLYDDLKEVKNEVYKTVCGTLSSTDRFAYLRLADYLTENNKYGESRKYHFTRITRNFMRNETKSKRVEE